MKAYTVSDLLTLSHFGAQTRLRLCPSSQGVAEGVRATELLKLDHCGRYNADRGLMLQKVLERLSY